MSPQLILTAALAPAAVTSALLVLGWMLWSRWSRGRGATPPGVTGIAIAAGFTAGAWLLFGRPALQPSDALGWTIHAAWAGALALTLTRLRLPGPARWGLALIAGWLLAAFLLGGRLGADWGGARGVLVVALTALAIAASYLALIGRRAPPALGAAGAGEARPARGGRLLAPLALAELTILAIGTSGAAVLSGTLRGGLIAGALASALGAATVVTWILPRAVSAAGAAGAAAPVLASSFIVALAYAELPIAAAVALALAPLLVAAGRRWLRRPPSVSGAIARLAFAVLPVAVAGALAARDYLAPPPASADGQGEYDYGYGDD
jgi:hypothetical protein